MSKRIQGHTRMKKFNQRLHEYRSNGSMSCSCMYVNCQVQISKTRSERGAGQGK